MMKQGTSIAVTAILAFVGGISVSVFTLPLWVALVINIAKEGSRSDWFGFAGSVLGAFTSVALGAVTLIVATRAIKPVWQQVRIMQVQAALQQRALIGEQEQQIARDMAFLSKSENVLVRVKACMFLSANIEEDADPELFKAFKWRAEEAKELSTSLEKQWEQYTENFLLDRGERIEWQRLAFAVSGAMHELIEAQLLIESYEKRHNKTSTLFRVGMDAIVEMAALELETAHNVLLAKLTARKANAHLEKTALDATVRT